MTKAPTCSSEGERLLTCKRCGETMKKEIAIDPNAHRIITEVDKSTNTANCTEEGRATAYEVCSICDEVFKTKRINTPRLIIAGNLQPMCGQMTTHPLQQPVPVIAMDAAKRKQRLSALR